MNLTNITAEFLRETGACEEGVEWYEAHPSVHDWPWEIVCSVLEAGGQVAWSRWVRLAVACYGSAEDRAALRDDPDAWVRRTVEHYARKEWNALVKEAFE